MPAFDAPLSGLEDLISEAAALARARRTGVRRPTAVRRAQSPVPDLSDALGQAARLVADKGARAAAEARVRAQREAYEKRIREQDQLFHRQGADELEMDGCEMRDPSVRGRPDYDLHIPCTLEHDHLAPGGLRANPTCIAGRLCYLCGKTLPKYARRWCSNKCSTTWWRNHLWREANTAALKRDDYTCQRCGITKYVTLAGQKTLRVDETCQTCDTPWPCEQKGHRSIRRFVELEVNHIDPLVGKGYANSCRHHFDGLETLCHPCHVSVTNAQRAERAAAKSAGVLGL